MEHLIELLQGLVQIGIDYAYVKLTGMAELCLCLRHAAGDDRIAILAAAA